MVRLGILGSLPFDIMIVFDELTPKKFVKRAVIMYEAATSMLPGMVIGLCI